MSGDGSPTAQSVTVVVPTHRRPTGLARVLAGLAAQDDPGVPWDVVVIDNDDDGRSAPVFDQADLPVTARLVVETRLGSAHARNRGMAEATGTMVAFLDDDVDPEPGWLRAVVEPILAGRCTGVGGRVILDPSVERPAWFAWWMAGYLAEYHPAEEECDLATIGPPTLTEPYLLTANAAFRADLLAATGGFDPLLGPRVGVPMVNDDVSLTRRFLAAGGVVRYVPAARVVHELPPSRLTRRYMARRLYAQGRSDWILDRDRTSGYRFGGLRGTVQGFVVRQGLIAVRGPRPQRPLSFLWCDGAHAAGFVREALAHSIRRRRPRGS